jgi:hypothetical protein
MKQEVYKNIFVGDIQSCQNDDLEDFAIVHACRTDCHHKGIDYKKKLNLNTLGYLISNSQTDIYLNLADVRSINSKATNSIFKSTFEFIDQHFKQNKKIFIHCYFGQSRSSSLALFYLAKKYLISNNSFEEALKDFRKIYSNEAIGAGFYEYLNNNWQDLMDL